MYKCPKIVCLSVQILTRVGVSNSRRNRLTLLHFCFNNAMTLADKILSLGIDSRQSIAFVCCCVQVKSAKLENIQIEFSDVFWTVDLRLI